MPMSFTSLGRNGGGTSLAGQSCNVAVIIDELFGQRSFNESQLQPGETLAQSVLAEGRYAHFIDRAYGLADQSWGIFSLERLARTPEFRQAAA